MLHILWLILKFILIMLGVILGLILLMVLLVLFCPVRYRAAVSKKGETRMQDVRLEAGVSWLFHGISFRVCYANRQTTHQIRILGISLDTLQRFLQRKKKKKITEPTSADRQPNVLYERTKNEKPNESSVWQEPERAEIPKIEKEPDEIVLETEETAPADVSSPRLRDKIKRILLLPVKTLKRIRDSIGRFVKKIRKITLTIRSIYDKIEWWKEFSAHPRTREALSLVWKDTKGLIRHILPVKTQGNVTFGCEDPSVTGTILAVLGMSTPLHKNRIAVTPLFDGENYLQGNAKIKGRIYGWVFLKTAVQLYFNKNVKYVISRWRHKEV